jgi:hypothetical protein
MGKHLDEHKRKMMEERLRDPHAWAYEFEQQRGSQAIFMLVLIAGFIALGIYVFTLKQDIAALELQLRTLQSLAYS